MKTFLAILPILLFSQSCLAQHCWIKVYKADPNNPGTTSIHNGSGTLIKNGEVGTILTAAHTFPESYDRIIVGFGDKTYGARLIKKDHDIDCAILIVKPPNVEPAKINSKYPIGNSYSVCGFGGFQKFRRVSGGYAGMADIRQHRIQSVMMRCGVRGGDSGGGVFNEDGELIGVVWGTLNGTSYFIPLMYVRGFLDEYRNLDKE